MPAANQGPFNEQFWAKPEKEQIAQLSSMSPKFKAAAPDVQRAYLQRKKSVGGGPLSVGGAHHRNEQAGGQASSLTIPKWVTTPLTDTLGVKDLSRRAVEGPAREFEKRTEKSNIPGIHGVAIAQDLMAGWTEGLTEAGMDLTAPANAALAALTVPLGMAKRIPKLARLVPMFDKAVRYGFSATMLSSLKDQVPAAFEAVQKKDYTTAGREIAHAIGEAVLATGMIKGGKGKKAEAPPAVEPPAPYNPDDFDVIKPENPYAKPPKVESSVVPTTAESRKARAMGAEKRTQTADPTELFRQGVPAVRTAVEETYELPTRRKAAGKGEVTEPPPPSTPSSPVEIGATYTAQTLPGVPKGSTVIFREDSPQGTVVDIVDSSGKTTKRTLPYKMGGLGRHVRKVSGAPPPPVGAPVASAQPSPAAAPAPTPAPTTPQAPKKPTGPPLGPKTVSSKPKPAAKPASASTVSVSELTQKLAKQRELISKAQDLKPGPERDKAIQEIRQALETTTSTAPRPPGGRKGRKTAVTAAQTGKPATATASSAPAPTTGSRTPTPPETLPPAPPETKTTESSKSPASQKSNIGQPELTEAVENILATAKRYGAPRIKISAKDADGKVLFENEYDMPEEGEPPAGMVRFISSPLLDIPGIYRLDVTPITDFATKASFSKIIGKTAAPPGP